MLRFEVEVGQDRFAVSGAMEAAGSTFEFGSTVVVGRDLAYRQCVAAAREWAANRLCLGGERVRVTITDEEASVYTQDTLTLPENPGQCRQFIQTMILDRTNVILGVIVEQQNAESD